MSIIQPGISDNDILFSMQFNKKYNEGRFGLEKGAKYFAITTNHNDIERASSMYIFPKMTFFFIMQFNKANYFHNVSVSDIFYQTIYAYHQ